MQTVDMRRRRPTGLTESGVADRELANADAGLHNHDDQYEYSAYYCAHLRRSS